MDPGAAEGHGGYCWFIGHVRGVYLSSIVALGGWQKEMGTAKWREGKGESWELHRRCNHPRTCGSPYLLMVHLINGAEMRHARGEWPIVDILEVVENDVAVG